MRTLKTPKNCIYYLFNYNIEFLGSPNKQHEAFTEERQSVSNTKLSGAAESSGVISTVIQDTSMKSMSSPQFIPGISIKASERLFKFVHVLIFVPFKI